MRPEAPPDPPRGAAARRAFALLREAARPERGHLWLALLWLVAAAGLEAMGPVLAKGFIDRHLVPRQGDLGAMAGLLGGALLAGWAASWVRYRQLSRLAGLAMRAVRRLRERVHAHVLSLPVARFDETLTGQLVSRVTNDTEAVKQLYVQVLFVVLDCAVVLFALMVTMALLDWRLMSIVAAVVPAVVLVVAGYRRLSAPAVARTRALRSEINAATAEAIGGMATLQATGAVEDFAHRYAALNEAHYRSRVDELRANAWLLRPALDLLKALLLAAVLLAFGIAVTGTVPEALELGVLYAFTTYIGRVTEPLIQLTTQFALFQQSVVAAARVDALLQEPPEQAPLGRGSVRGGALHIRSLDFAYASGTPVLQGIDLTVSPGEFIGVVGATGSGKSTLLSLLLRFYPAPPASIRVDGVPLEELEESHLRDRVAFVPQEPFLWAASVRDNIAMGRPLDDEAVSLAAASAGAADFIGRLPLGYDTQVGEGGARLSTGQRQLLAIARALAGAPAVLLLDEATAHVDSATEQQVQRALTSLRGRVTVISVAHRLSTVRAADRIAVLHHGRIAELGPHEALMDIDGGLYRRLVELQQLASDEEDG